MGHWPFSLFKDSLSIITNLQLKIHLTRLLISEGRNTSFYWLIQQAKTSILCFPAEYSVDVNGYVLVYSIDSLHSFEVCKSIHEKLMDLVGGSVPIILVGNKTDLHVDRRVTHEQG